MSIYRIVVVLVDESKREREGYHMRAITIYGNYYIWVIKVLLEEHFVNPTNVISFLLILFSSFFLFLTCDVLFYNGHFFLLSFFLNRAHITFPILGLSKCSSRSTLLTLWSLCSYIWVIKVLFQEHFWSVYFLFCFFKHNKKIFFFFFFFLFLANKCA